MVGQKDVHSVVVQTVRR